MSTSKVVDLDPKKRMTKEAFEQIKTSLSTLDPDKFNNFILLHTSKDGEITFEAFGIDWEITGIMQAYLEDLRAELLQGPEEDD